MLIDRNNNYLFIGDNLPIMLDLNIKNYFDVCYIDPPYNTHKNMGKYKDNFKSHNDWLLFIRPRLEASIPMLKKSGIIFISIGVCELPYLMILCNELFGEKNFISLITWQSKYTVANDKKGISSQTEYILVYAKDKNYVKINNDKLRQDYVDKTYKNPDNDPRGSWRGGIQLFKKKNKHEFTVISPTGKKWTKAWNYNEESWKNKLEANDLIYWGENGDKCPVKKVFLADVEKRGRGIPNLWMGKDVGYTSTGTADLEAFVGDSRDFLYPKPINLIKRILRIAGGQDACVLDFFAGTGTTAQAVIELNTEDDGNRQFVLITKNENNLVDEITIPRLLKIKNGYNHAKTGNIIKGIDFNLEINNF